MGRRKKGSNKRGGNALPDAVSDDEGGVVGEEGVYDEVDAWANGEDAELAAAVKNSTARRKVKAGKVEMFALSGTDSDSDLELPKFEKKKKKKKKKSTAEEEIAMNDEDFLGSDVEGEDADNIHAWGSTKKHFYGGNTGEAIATSDEDFSEDEEEEKEAKLLQERQLDRMQEEDFLDTFVIQDNNDKVDEDVVEESVKVDLSSLSAKQLATLFRQQAPEFDGIVLDFKQKMAEAVGLSRIVWLEDSGALPPGPALEYVRVRFQLLTNYCTNIAAYLMFKSKGTNLKLHPVTGRLVQYKQLIDSMESMDAIIRPQIDSLLSRLEGGEAVENIVKEEKRRQRKKESKKQNKNKQLKLLQKKANQVEEANEDAKKKNKKKGRGLEDDEDEDGLQKKKRKVDDLTGDEKMAVELYKAMRRNKADLESESEEGEEMSEDEEKGEERVMHQDNVDLDAQEEEGDEKRGITYKIAKNKGLMPKRSKQQRNPRVKHRLKFEKAKKRRKGAVREVRTETTKYGGEVSGINARVKKGVKIS